MAGKTYNRIKEILARVGKTNLELADYMGVHEQTVSGWCTNHNQPQLSKLYMIADFFNVEVEELLNLKKDLEVVKTRKKTTTVRKKASKKAATKK